MWTVELNVLGRRFTRTAGQRPEQAVRRTARLVTWRQWRQRHPGAAA
jgi:hypothetical protein